jgi:ATP-dependent RNA helicase RhlE
MPFTTLGLDDRLLRAIKDAGYTEPTPIQAAAVPLVLAGHDLIGVAQTGTGKTAAFTLPMLSMLAGAPPVQGRRKTRALVLAPTRELVVQIEENVVAYGKYVPLRIAKVFGGVGERPQVEALRSGAELVIATPGRLMDLMGQGHADFSGLQFLVLDEADRMLDMGFVPAIRKIVKVLPRTRQTLLFSATLSKEIEVLTKEFQHQPKKVEIGRRSNPAETVTQFIYEVTQEHKPALLAHLLRDSALNMVLIFTRTKHGADRVAKRLSRDGITTATLHANRSQSQRLRALDDFKSGKVRVLVATDIAARGIDVDGISHVVNFDFPPHMEDYVHRIGRTGRANAVGDAISFVTREDYAALRTLERFIGRGIIRKQAEGFDPKLFPVLPREAPASRGRQQQQRPQQQRSRSQNQSRPQRPRQENRDSSPSRSQTATLAPRREEEAPPPLRQQGRASGRRSKRW